MNQARRSIVLGVLGLAALAGLQGCLATTSSTTAKTFTPTSTWTPIPPPTATPTTSCSTANHSTVSSCGSYNHTLYPTTSSQLWYDSFTYNGDIFFYVYMYAGWTYHFSLCASGAYTAGNCGDFHLYNSGCSSVASWVTCTGNYELNYSVSTTGAYYLQIHNGVCSGTTPTCFAMAYWYQ